MKNPKLKLIVILGPTASGKTGLAIELSKKFNGEIVSADSRQVYKKMNIGTAKPTKKETQGIPHYLIDIINPDEKFNVAIYQKLAIKDIKDIQKRKKNPFLVGGTGLYIQAIVDNLCFLKIPAQKKLRNELEKKTVDELFKIYEKLDSVGAKIIERKNKRRLVRAIEVCKATGRPFWQQRKKEKPLFDILQIGIETQTENLKTKIDKRVEEMFDLGLKKEVKSLIKRYGSETPPLQTIGYHEWNDYFRNKTDKKEVAENIKLHTIQFAKRQMTWFKRDKRIKWIKTGQEAKNLVKTFLSKK